MPESNSPTWKGPYLAALKETNKEKLTELVYAAAEAIFLRERELRGSDDHHPERLELKQACEGLLSIQANKLGRPSFLPTQPSLQND